MKRIYIAGKMTDLPELNFPAFADAAKRLRAAGFDVVSPVEICPDKGIEWAAAMRLDIPAMLECDAVVLLDGWENSRGAKLEKHIAEALGMPCWPIGAVLPMVRFA